jgi:hypothetical protein
MLAIASLDDHIQAYLFILTVHQLFGSPKHKALLKHQHLARNLLLCALALK